MSDPDLIRHLLVAIEPKLPKGDDIDDYMDAFGGFGVALGFLLGIIIGFICAGIGGAIVGAVIGAIVGLYLVPLFVWLAILTLGFLLIMLIIVAITWVIMSLWNVGKP